MRVRFQEVDSLRVVWHGHYLSYFEEGRNAFGRRYGFGYQDILAAGYIAPLVHLSIDYFRPARFDQVLDVETRMHLEPGARIRFAYRIHDPAGEQVAGGCSTQVFTDPDGELCLVRPAFFAEFLARWHDEAQHDPPRDVAPDRP
ncbi:MAG: acyl-CoA thioesterase [Planctomycetes bacterium]|nr:acyl-CoA thioesterase [Planctomycetota bacterium]